MTGEEQTAVGGMMTQCPECGEIIGVNEGYYCALCGQRFHLDCLDPDTLCCLECTLVADVLDHTPQSPDHGEDEAEER